MQFYRKVFSAGGLVSGSNRTAFPVTCFYLATVACLFPFNTIPWLIQIPCGNIPKNIDQKISFAFKLHFLFFLQHRLFVFFISQFCPPNMFTQYLPKEQDTKQIVSTVYQFSIQRFSFSKISCPTKTREPSFSNYFF